MDVVWWMCGEQSRWNPNTLRRGDGVSAAKPQFHCTGRTAIQFVSELRNLGEWAILWPMQVFSRKMNFEHRLPRARNQTWEGERVSEAPAPGLGSTSVQLPLALEADRSALRSLGNS